MAFCYIKYVDDLVSYWSEHIVFPVVVLLPVSVCIASFIVYIKEQVTFVEADQLINISAATVMCSM